MTAGIETRGAGGVPLAAPRAVPEHVLPDEEPPAGAPAVDTGPIDEAVVTGRALHAALSGVLLGTPVAVTTAVVAALSGSHLLIEDVPGVGKTVLARALATALGVELSRVQGHPDLLPSDITGVTVFSPDNGTWEFRPGPVFGHVVLLDEMNRTPPRTQSALLEAMEEQQVSVDGESWPLPVPTWSSAPRTRSASSAPTRWSRASSTGSGSRPPSATRLPTWRPSLCSTTAGATHWTAWSRWPTPTRWRRAIAATASVHVATPVAEYAVSLVRATRTAGTVRLGASPRAAISLLRSAQAYAVLSARAYTTPQDVQAVAVACLAHRLIAEGGSDGGPALVGRMVADLPVPPT